MSRIALVYPYYNLDSVPSLHNTAVLLAEHGYRVDIFTIFDEVHLRPKFDSQWISVLPISTPTSSHTRIPWRPFIGRIFWLLRLFVRHWRSEYVCIMGVDPAGLAKARQTITRWLRVPLAYYSLELLLSYETTTERERRLKSQERRLSQQAPFVIIQDQERADLLIRDNHLSPARVICVPNAPLGPANSRRTGYLRDKFDLPAGTKIILHTGSMEAWAGTEQLIRSTNEWPDDWVLVCHSRSRDTSRDRDHLAVLQKLAKPGRVIFSLEPVPHDQYPALVQSANVGVAFYVTQPGSPYTQDNIYHIGLSSGKLAYYLWAGVPVIVNDLPSLRRLVTTYHCGEVTEPAVTREVIQRILANHETYSHNAIDCFNRELNFAGSFKKVLAALDSLR